VAADIHAAVGISLGDDSTLVEIRKDLAQDALVQDSPSERFVAIPAEQSDASLAGASERERGGRWL
jgi:hypothetical protein